MKRKFIASLFIIGIILSGCQQDDDDNNNNNNVTVNSTSQFTATIDGTNYSYVQGTADVNTSVGWALSLTSTIKVIFQEFFYNNITSVSYATVNRGRLTFPNGSGPSASEFDAYFAVGNYSFTQSEGTGGFKVIWFDSNQDDWSTENGSADQTGSSFHVDEVLSQNISGSHYIKVKATFNCKLYNVSGQSKTLTNGVFVGMFQHYVQ